MLSGAVKPSYVFAFAAVSEFVVYVKPEENAAYYVINGEGSDSYRIDL